MNKTQEKITVSVSAEEQIKGIFDALEKVDERIDILSERLMPALEENVAAKLPSNMSSLDEEFNQSLITKYPPLNEALESIFRKINNKRERLKDITERITL